MRAQPIVAAASEHERHALEARFQPHASTTSSPGTGAGNAARSPSALPNWHRTTQHPLATTIRSAAEPRSASRDAAFRRQYRFGSATGAGAGAGLPPLSPILSTSTPHTNRSNHARQASAHSQAHTHRTGTNLTDLSDSETDAHQAGVSPTGSSFQQLHLHATPPGRSVQGSPRATAGQRPTLNDTDLDRLDRLQMKTDLQSATARAGASRFRPKNHPPRTTTTGTTAVDTEHPSISGGSGTASEASTKVAGWDGGSRSPSRLIVPSGVDVGRGVPRPGLWMADVTGMTEALQSPAKGWYTQHDQWSEPPLGAYAQQRYQQLRQYTSDLDGMRQAVLERSTTTKQAQPQPQQRPQRSTTQRSSAPAQPTLSHRDISPRLPSSPSPPFPQGPHTDAVWPDNRDQILDRIDDTQAQINELIAQPGLPAQLAHASHATAGQRNDDATTRQLDDKFMLGLLHREIREIRAMVSNLVDHSQYTRDTCTKLDERTTRMDARLGGLESNFSDFRAEMHQKLESMSESSKKEQVELLSSSLSPPTTDHPTLPSLREWSQRVTTATGGSDTDRATAPSEPVQPEERRHEQAVQSQSSPRRPAMVEPLSSGPHSVGSQHLSSPTRSGTSRFRRRQTALPQPLPPSDAPTVPSSASHYAQVTTTTHQATDHAGDSMAGDDVSGTMLSELELSRTVDTGHDTDHRGVVDPPATQKSTTTTTTHVVDHSHDPKKCVPCTRARRLERKRQARLAAAAAERQRKEDERIATHALVEQLQTVLDNQGTEAGKTWVLTLDRTDQELLLSLHARRLDDFYHQRTIWSGLTDEVRNFEATDVMHSLTSKHMKEAFHLFELYADQIDVLTLILPTAPTAPTASTTAAAPRVNGL